MTEYGQINFSAKQIQIGPAEWASVVEGCSWEGPDLAIVSKRFLPAGAQVGDIAEIGPYVVRLIDRDYPANGFVVARCDSLHGDWLAAIYPIRIKLEEIACRFVATLAVWGLADWPMNERPTWRHIKAFRK